MISKLRWWVSDMLAEAGLFVLGVVLYSLVPPEDDIKRPEELR